MCGVKCEGVMCDDVMCGVMCEGMIHEDVMCDGVM